MFCSVEKFRRKNVWSENKVSLRMYLRLALCSHLGINDGKITSQGATVANLYGNINKVSRNAGDSGNSLLTVAIAIEFHVTVNIGIYIY